MNRPDADPSTDVREQHDPLGLARRHPASLHAHQDDWPIQCRSLTRQSPIALSSARFTDHPAVPMRARLGASQVSLLDVSHTFQARVTHTQDEVDFEGKRYRFAQVHFHKPSEHIVDGRQYDMEAHFVFLASDTARTRSALVLGFLLTQGSENLPLAPLWSHLPPYREAYGEDLSAVAAWQDAIRSNELELDTLHHGERLLRAGLPLDNAALFPAHADLLVYEGSLTTPGCNEGVTHAVSTVPLHMSEHQIEHFEGYYEGNNRDIQPTGDREARRFRVARLATERR